MELMHSADIIEELPAPYALRLVKEEASRNS
jgi:hypothetical protein